MSKAKIAKTTINLVPDSSTQLTFIAKGETVIFDGFLKVYGHSKDSILPDLKPGDKTAALSITARQTFAKPPARYTEGSLVKKLEELGIGRPSTYASIMNALQARKYVVKGDSEGEVRKVLEITLKNDQITRQTVTEKSGATKGKLLPTPIGELISDFLTEHFEQIVDYGFTAGIEQKLDQIAEQKLKRVKMLSDFYTPFAKLVGNSSQINRYNSANELGVDPKTGLKIYAKIGRNGGFIQLGENEKESGQKPRFVPLPKGKTVKTVSLEQALSQLSLPELPRSLGKAKDGVELIAANGPFGPYLKADRHNIPLKGHNPYNVTLDAAEELYQAKKASIIADWGEIQIIKGVYGPYIKGPTKKGTRKRNNCKIPEDLNPTNITLEQAKEMLENKPVTRRRSTKKSKK